MPLLQSETFGGGDQSWLASTHGLANARTASLNVAAFTAATHYPDGYLPSGYPVAEVDNRLVPYDAAATTGAQNIAGHVVEDVPIRNGAARPTALLDHGRVKVARVPQPGFTAPAAQPNTTIVYI